MFLLPQIRSLHQPKPVITSTAIMVTITARSITTTASTTITAKRRTVATATTKITRSEIVKRTMIGLMKRQFTTKS